MTMKNVLSKVGLDVHKEKVLLALITPHTHAHGRISSCRYIDQCEIAVFIYHDLENLQLVQNTATR